jgi:hypothetical protein
MSCDSFESCVVDLARGDELAAGVRDQALSHAEGCLRCAARLEDERSVTGALRAFAARTATAEAPPWVETALIRAMRAPEAGSAGHEIAKPSRAVELLLLAAAAAILAAIVVLPPRFGPLSGGARPAAAVGLAHGAVRVARGLGGRERGLRRLDLRRGAGRAESLQVVSGSCRARP